MPSRIEVDMGEISDVLKRRIVVELATFKSAAEVRTILREEYGEDVPASAIYRYDAARDYCATGEALRTLFHQTRKEYVTALSDLPIAHLAFRLRKLQGMSLAAERQGNFKLAAEMLEQAAKDHGGLFTNIRQLQGQMEHRHAMTPDEARERVRSYLERRKVEGADTQH